MFGKSEDKWIEIAFGEQKLPEGFSAKDADDEEILKAYESLRDDLQLLKDIPEMQFSNERLRDAILAAGPKASVETPWVIRWGWAIAPVAAMLAVGVVFLKGNLSGTEPNVIVAPGSLQNSTAIASNNSLATSEAAAVAPAQSSVLKQAEPSKSEMLVTKTRVKSFVRRKVDGRPSGVRLAMATPSETSKKALGTLAATARPEAVSLASDGSVGSMALTRDADSGSGGVAGADAMMAPGKADLGGNVVLIDASSDSVTGLPNATEVSKNSEKVALGG